MQGVLRGGRQAQAAQSQAGAVQLQKPPGQQQHVVATFAQRWNGDGVHRQAVVQVGAEAAVAHMLTQTAVGGGDDPHVHPPGAVGTQALDLAVLQGAQQFGLHGQRQLAHLVKEQCAAFGRFKPAGPVAHRPRERAPHVTKQLTFGQRLGQGGAVHMHQRLGCAA